uniref:Bridge-like lipid transfer protein family member 3B n=1 Tax=Nothobranchius furzeri TaxID=105023 RepID=A0A8C6KUT4_NOTFU
GCTKLNSASLFCRFAKNLSPDKINLSTLKGEGQLTNLELDEEVLQSVLDLPTWLAINRVFCNKATIRIPWTKLKTHPISLSLDKVMMEMSTCDEPRPPNGPSPIATASGQSEYGFAEKVVEGISLSINSIVIKISAKAFNASFELSQLQVHSVNTSWSISDLRFTRIQDPQRGEILMFKEISWQMIRIEADAIQSAEHEMLSAPIRLITNQSKIRVTLKRRIKDCNVVTSKLILILDDLLWVLTDSQLKAMVQYAKSLSEAMEKSAQQRKSMATDDQVSSQPPSAQQVRTHQASPAADQSATIAKLFAAYDVCETSHHLQITHLDLHICDDIHAKDKVINKRITGGAMQLSFSSITLDYYPFHRAGESCVHWMHYSEATKARESWATSLLDEFKSNVEMLKSAVRDKRSPRAARSSPHHGKRSHTENTRRVILTCPPPPPQSPKTQLMSSSVVVRMADFSIYQVSTADQRRSTPKTMISCNKKSLYLPAEMPAVHVEFTEYYFPDGKDYPIPCPNLYAQLNALQLVLDPRSLVWINLFALDLRQSLEQFMEIYKLNDSQKPDEHVDIKVDGLMLKLVVPTDQDACCPADLPRSVSVQTSEMTATNTRHPANCTRSHLEALLQAFEAEPFFSSSFSSFPRSSSSVPILHSVFQQHAHEQDTKMHDVYRGLVVPTMGADALKMPAASDFWALHFAQFWVDYEGTCGGKGRPQPFVDSFPLTVWACQPVKLVQHQENLRGSAGAGLSRSTSMEAVARLQRKRLLKEYYSTDSAPSSAVPPSNGLYKPPSLDSLSSSSSSSSSKDADVHMLVHVQKHISAQVSHRQFVFLMLLQRSLKALQQTLQQDLEDMISKRERKDTSQHPAEHQPFTFCLGLLLKSAEVSLLLKPVPQPEGTGSPAGSELSPSESRGTLEPVSDAGDGSEKGNDGSGSEGRAAKPPSTSSFSVSYKNMKKSPSLQSLDNISIDSSLLEDGDTYSLDRGGANQNNFVFVERKFVQINMINSKNMNFFFPIVNPPLEADDCLCLQVSVLVLKVHSVCVSMESVGESSAVALEVGKITPSQLGNVSLRQYLSNRSLGDTNSASNQTNNSPEVRARLESGPCVAAHSPLAMRNGFLQLHLHGYHASFVMSTLRNLALFLEDDSASQVLPMEISVRDTHIDLKVRKLRCFSSSVFTSALTDLLIRSDAAAEAKSKKANLLTDSSLSAVPETVSSVCRISKATQTQTPPTSSGPSAKEKILMEENECLKVELSRTKMALAEAQMEKDSLLHRIKNLKTNSS